MFSITGEQDHTPFGATGIQLVWGQRPDGSHVHISEVPSGLKCDCICPACGFCLAAHKGRKLAHNFHHVNGQACAGARETNAHVWAKKILEARKEVWIPAGIATAGKERKRAFAAQLFKFDFAHLEKRTGAIIPDVVLTAGERKLIVEIRVTHASDEIKIAKIREQGTSALEIDLSGLRRAESEETVALALIGTDEIRRAPRHWLFNVKVDQASERLAVEVSRRESEKQARLAQAAAQRKARLQREAQSIVRAATSLKIVATDATLEDMRIATSYGLREHVGLPIQGLGFRVPSMLWQSAILSRVVIEGIDWMSGIRPAITLRMAIEAIHQNCLVDNVASLPSDDLRAAVLEADPAFVFSGDAIGRYLAHLESVGILAREYFYAPKHSAFVGWRVSGPAVSQLRTRQTELAEQNRRNVRASESLRLILDQVPTAERQGFSFDRWQSRQIDELGAHLADLVEEGGEGWRAFCHALDKILRMFRDGPPVQQTLGLPITGEIARATKREGIKQEETARLKREAEEKAARERGDSLSRRAVEIFGHDCANHWLTTISRPEQLSFIELARRSCDGFNQAQQALGVAERELLDRQRREQEAQRCRSELRMKAVEAFGSERAEVFLLSTHPRLGTSPWLRCTDVVGLRDCDALLPKKTQSRHFQSRVRG